MPGNGSRTTPSRSPMRVGQPSPKTYRLARAAATPCSAPSPVPAFTTSFRRRRAMAFAFAPRQGEAKMAWSGGCNRLSHHHFAGGNEHANAVSAQILRIFGNSSKSRRPIWPSRVAPVTRRRAALAATIVQSGDATTISGVGAASKKASKGGPPATQPDSLGMGYALSALARDCRLAFFHCLGLLQKSADLLATLRMRKKWPGDCGTGRKPDYRALNARLRGRANGVASVPTRGQPLGSA